MLRSRCTYVHAYCVITNTLSWYMCYVKYGRFIMETKVCYRIV